jgi:hypothetical protein
MNGPKRINSLRYKQDIVYIKKYLIKMGPGYNKIRIKKFFKIFYKNE